ncbi:hypothetical protein GCM10017044_06540 [Kordiimonas sediminis]|uniref:Beta-lactamase-related domain-containing protein n=1 Tax=Kordiimonas sediminis TaxID=1735581 RepID=A0A919E5I3_9PROT|nr:serine hydrolase [Kordiimonas sediminis]GHF15090.1 hypothetical protein GCM10017044_06540 [Kordiimonas sediminis]
MVRFFKYCFGTLIVLFVGLVVFYFQPWSDYPPSTLASTFEPDKRVENFRNMDTLYPYVSVPKGDTVFEYPEAMQPLGNSYTYDGESKKLNSFFDKTQTTGLLVIKDGTIIHEMYRLGETRASKHTSWSVAKSFVSTLIGMAIEDGLIQSVEDRVEIYVPDLVGTAYGAATIEDVLQMSSGVDFSESYGEAGSNTAFNFSDAQKVLYRTWLLGDSLDDILAGYEKLEDPGERFYYRSSDTHILSWILREVTGKPVEQYLSEKLWKPLGMEADAYWSTDGVGTPIGFCCLNAVLRDYAKLGSLYINGGVWNGQQLISEDWVKRATRPSKPHLEPEHVGGNRGYQYQWWVPKDYDGEYIAMGIWGQYIWVSEKAGVVIARTSVDPAFRNHLDETIAVFRAITDQVSPVSADQ